MKNKHTLSDLYQMQNLSLDAKIRMTRRRIKDWIDTFGEDGVYVSFSGGKDSTVLLDIVRKDYPNIEAVFVNTGLEYPSVRKFAESKENVTVLRPKMNFREVLCKYGYPIISKEISGKASEVRKSIAIGNIDTVRYRQFMGLEKKDNGEPSEFNCEHYKFLLEAPFNISDECCEIMKKRPIHQHDRKNSKHPIIAIMADESRQRRTKWIIHGCNAFDMKYPQSNPLSFWTENDVLSYIHKYITPLLKKSWKQAQFSHGSVRKRARKILRKYGYSKNGIAEAYGEVVVKGTEDGQISLADVLGDYRDCKFTTTGCKRTGCIFCGFGITQDKDRFIRLSEQEPKLCDYVMRGGAFDTDGMWKPTNDGLGYWFVLEWINLYGLGIGIPNREYYVSEYATEQTKKYFSKY